MQNWSDKYHHAHSKSSGGRHDYVDLKDTLNDSFEASRQDGLWDNFCGSGTPSSASTALEPWDDRRLNCHLSPRGLHLYPIASVPCLELHFIVANNRDQDVPSSREPPLLFRARLDNLRKPDIWILFNMEPPLCGHVSV